MSEKNIFNIYIDGKAIETDSVEIHHIQQSEEDLTNDKLVKPDIWNVVIETKSGDKQ